MQLLASIINICDAREILKYFFLQSGIRRITNANVLERHENEMYL